MHGSDIGLSTGIVSVLNEKEINELRRKVCNFPHPENTKQQNKQSFFAKIFAKKR